MKCEVLGAAYKNGSMQDPENKAKEIKWDNIVLHMVTTRAFSGVAGRAVKVGKLNREDAENMIGYNEQNYRDLVGMLVDVDLSASNKTESKITSIELLGPAEPGAGM